MPNDFFKHSHGTKHWTNFLAASAQLPLGLQQLQFQSQQNLQAATDFLPRGLQSSNNSLRWICKRMQLIFHFLAASAQFNCQLPFNGIIGLQQLQQQEEDLQELIVGRRWTVISKCYIGLNFFISTITTGTAAADFPAALTVISSKC